MTKEGAVVRTVARYSFERTVDAENVNEAADTLYHLVDSWLASKGRVEPPGRIRRLFFPDGREGTIYKERFNEGVDCAGVWQLNEPLRDGGTFRTDLSFASAGPRLQWRTQLSQGSEHFAPVSLTVRCCTAPGFLDS